MTRADAPILRRDLDRFAAEPCSCRSETFHEPSGCATADADSRELWKLVATGTSDDAIAERWVYTRTIKRRVSDLYQQLDVEGRVEAAALAGRTGMLDEPVTERDTDRDAT